MSPFDYFKTAITEKYADFNGRARRSEYWYFTLFSAIFSTATFVVDITLETGFLNLIYSLVVFVPSLAVGVRRLHDTGRSGWNFLLALIPLIGAIILLVWFCTDSDPHTNDYGPNPKDPDAGIDDITDHLVTDPKELV